MNKIIAILLAVILLITGTLAIFSAYLYNELNTIKKSTPYEVSGNTLIENLNSRLTRSDNSDEQDVPEAIPVQNTNVSYSFSDCTDCEDKVKKLIDDAISGIPTPTPITITTSTSSSSKTQTSYVPLGTTASSTSTDWYSVGNASAYIDLANDFDTGAYVTFEASLKIKHGNGEAHARLWDDTNKIAVDGSELVTSGNEDYEYKKSGRVYLWNGNNNYMVQIKSVGGYEATVSDAKVKVVY